MKLIFGLTIYIFLCSALPTWANNHDEIFILDENQVYENNFKHNIGLGHTLNHSYYNVLIFHYSFYYFLNEFMSLASLIEYNHPKKKNVLKVLEESLTSDQKVTVFYPHTSLHAMASIDLIKSKVNILNRKFFDLYYSPEISFGLDYFDNISEYAMGGTLGLNIYLPLQNRKGFFLKIRQQFLYPQSIAQQHTSLILGMTL